MSNKMRHLGTRVDDTFYERVQQHVEKLDISTSEFVRIATERMLVSVPTKDHLVLAGMPTDFQQTLAELSQQLSTKDALIERKEAQVERIQADMNERIRQLAEELTESRRGSEGAAERHDTIVLTLTQQLDHANLQLEDLRQARSKRWWQRLFRQKG